MLGLTVSVSKGGAFLVPPLDIFKVGTNGQLRWIEAVWNLETAKAHVALLGENSPGKYIILNQTTEEKFVLHAGAPSQSKSA